MAKGRDKRKRIAKRNKQAHIRNGDALRDYSPIRPGDPPVNDEPDPFVYASLKPKPHLGSGAIALCEPHDHRTTDLFSLTQISKASH